ncbi:MAG: phosphotransferase enzyme family protein [Candidatus Hodarchaeales archaeon]
MRFIWDQYQQGESGLVFKFLNSWESDPKSLKGINFSANAIFSFNSQSGEKILRITYQTSENSAESDWRERNESLLTAELDFIEYLRSKKFSTPKPIKSKFNRFIEKIISPEGIFYAVVFTRVKGKIIELEDMSLDQITIWGQLMAKFHQASLKFKPKNFKRRNWEKDISLILKEFDPEDNNLKKRGVELYKWIETLIPNEENFGLIHYDLCPDNLIWDENNTPFIIDLDDLAYYFFTADIAFISDDLKDDSRGETVFQTFIEGYLSIKGLPDEFHLEIENFLELMILLKYARLKRSYRNHDKNNTPDWFLKMRERHSQKLKTIKEKY